MSRFSSVLERFGDYQRVYSMIFNLSREINVDSLKYFHGGWNKFLLLLSSDTIDSRKEKRNEKNCINWKVGPVIARFRCAKFTSRFKITFHPIPSQEQENKKTTTKYWNSMATHTLLNIDLFPAIFA